MADLDALLASIPIGDIAKQLGIDEDVAEAGVKQVLPALVGGMAANAQDAGGAASLEKALASHSGKSAALVDVDTADGDKIVRNVFGSRTDHVVAAVAKTDSKVDESIIQKLLPIVAPIVLAWLASQFLNKKSEPATKSASSGGGIGDLLGGLVGSKQGQDMLGGLLGGLLGGGKK